MVENTWGKPPEQLKAAEEEVHVWRVPFSGYLSSLKDFRKILSPDEINRADRFYFEKDRNSFTISRACLRIILGRYLSLSPEKLVFEYNQYGKPGLDERQAAGISFNLSHSEDLALYAVSHKRQVGIDVEYIREKVSYKEICVRFFSPAEVKALCDLPESLHKEAFFNCWTRKEAYIKAKGKGLAIPLHLFDVSLVPGEPALILETRDEPGTRAEWFIYELFPGKGYKAALAAQGKNLPVYTWNLEPML